MPRASTISAARARDSLSELINRAAYGKERVVLTRRGKALVGMVPLEDIKLLEELEDRADAREAKKRLAAWERSGRNSISLDELAAKYRVKIPKRRGVSR